MARTTFEVVLSTVISLTLAGAWTPKEAVSEMNRRVMQLDDGVLIHGFHAEYPTKTIKPFLNKNCTDWSHPETCPDNLRMSFSLMNRFAWDDENGNYSFYPRLSGFIAAPNTSLRCLFPSDGCTTTRQLNGCGKWHTGPLDPVGNESDWCDHLPEDFATSWPGYNMGVRFSCAFCNVAEWTGCVLRGDKRKEMLNAYGTARKARAVTQGPQQKAYGKTGLQISTSGSWNEVIVDGSYWNNKVVGTNLDAFFIGVPCVMNPDCKNDALRHVSEYKEMFGFAPPLIGFSPRQYIPFYEIESVQEQVLV